MPKIAFVLFFSLLFNSLFAQEDPGIWAGGGAYKPGESIGDALKSLGGEKKIVLQINSAGEITGTLDVTYNKAIATRPNDAVDASFLIGGKYDSATHTLLLVITHLKATNSSTADKKFKYPDSLLYTVTLGKQQGRVEMTGAIKPTPEEPFMAEWLSSNRNTVMALSNSGKINMHVLPLSIRLEKFVLPAEEAPVAVKPPPVKKDAVVTPPPVDTKKMVTVAVTIPPVQKEPDTPQPQIDRRKTEIQHTIYLDTSLVKLDMYDNGEVDGDIATLILDGKVIIANQLLSTKAASITLHISKDQPEHLLELYANNLGTIPPNTALLVLTCNRKRYEINLSSNGTENGTVKLVFAKK